MTYTLAILTVALLTSVFAWGMVYAQRRKDPVNRALRLFLLTQSAWIFTELIYHSTLSVGHEPLWQRVTALFWMSIGFAFLHAVYRLVHRPNDWLYYLIGGLSLVSIALIWVTDLGVTGFVRHDWGVADVPGPLHTPVLTTVGALGGVVALVLLFTARRRTRDPDRRRSYTLLCIGGAVAVLLTWSLNALIPVVLAKRAFPQLGAATLAVICPFIYSAVVRYDFLRIDLEELASELFKDSREGLVLIDPEGYIRRTNPAAQRLLGLDDVRGQDIEEVLSAVVSERDFSNRLHHGMGPDGSRVLSISQATHRRRSNVRGRILVLQDVTRREEMSQVLERSRDEAERELQLLLRELAQAQKVGVIGTLAGGIAHDFNNLLGVVQGFASMTYGDIPAGHPAREKLAAVLEATERAQEIVQQILAFSRREPPQRRAIAAHWVVDESLKLLEVSLPATIRIHRRVDPDAGTVMGDQQQLKQVLLNLVTNAYQVMGPDGGELLISLEGIEVTPPFAHDHPPLEPGPHVLLSVQDSGPGMDAETQRQIFDPFFTTRETSDSTGLGLSTALHIVRDHGGAITVESAPGEGANFSVYLPTITP